MTTDSNDESLSLVTTQDMVAELSKRFDAILVLTWKPRNTNGRDSVGVFTNGSPVILNGLVEYVRDQELLSFDQSRIGGIDPDDT